MGHTTTLYTTKQVVELAIIEICANSPRMLNTILANLPDVNRDDAEKALYELESSGRVHINSAGFISLPKKAIQ